MKDTNNSTAKTILSTILNKQNRNKNFKIIQTPFISTPMISGIIKPCIFLPDIDLSEEELTYILEHETAHYFHGDLWIKFIVEILSIIYWWNPLVYLLKKQISRILEIHTDITITKKLDEIGQIAYLECLLKIAKQCKRSYAEQLSLPLIAKNKQTMSQRFHIVLEQQNERKNSFLSSLALFPMLIITILSFCIIFEACFFSSDINLNDGLTVLTEDNAYLIPNTNGGYDVYYEDEFFLTAPDLEWLGVDLPIYYNTKDKPSNK